MPGRKDNGMSEILGQTKEYQEGWRAYSDGISLRGNPYKEGTAAFYVWHRGWLDKDELERDNAAAVEDAVWDDPTQH
jgi:hypothetical protein